MKCPNCSQELGLWRELVGKDAEIKRLRELSNDIYTLLADHDRLEAMNDQLQAELERVRCRHGWRGSVPEDGQHIVTPCPECGSQSLFIGKGGHLTCSRIPSDFGDGCQNPSVEDVVNSLKRELAEARADSERLDWLETTRASVEWYGGKTLPCEISSVGDRFPKTEGKTLRQAIDAARGK